MGDHKNLARDISKLESMIPSGFFSSAKADWKLILLCQTKILASDHVGKYNVVC